MIEDFKIGIKLSLISDVARKLGEITKQFTQLNKTTDVYQKQLNDLQLKERLVNLQLEKRLSIAKTYNDQQRAILTNTLALSRIEQQRAQLQEKADSKNKINTGLTGTVGSAAATGATGIFGFLGYAVSQAAELQKKMIGVQIATNGTTGQMQKLLNTVLNAQFNTVFNAVDVANMAQIISTSNRFNADQVSSLLPVYARFADIQKLLKGSDYQSSTVDATRIAHLAGAYTPQSLASVLDMVTKASLIMPDGTGSLATALKYSMPRMRANLGMSNENIIALTAFASSMGFSGSQGGTNVLDALIRTVPGVFGSGLLKGKSNEALRQMNLVDGKGNSLLFTNGKFDVMKWMQGLSSFVSNQMSKYPEEIARQNILIAFQHAFGQQGARFASLFATPQALNQWVSINEKFRSLDATTKMQSIFADKAVSQQFMNFGTNIKTLITELGYVLLPVVSKHLKVINNNLSDLNKWIQAHPEALKKIVKGLLFVGGIFATISVVMLALSSPLGMITVAVGFLTIALFELWKGIKVLLSEIKDSFNSTVKGVSNVYHGAVNYVKNSHPVDSALDFFKSRATTNNMHVTLNMDGRQVGKGVAKANAKAASAPNSATNLYDSYSTMLFPSFNGNS